jgi:hypothetical protein
VGGVPRNGLARIRANGTVTPWNPNSNSSALALAVMDSTVYLGGGFTQIAGESPLRPCRGGYRAGAVLRPWQASINSTGQLHRLCERRRVSRWRLYERGRCNAARACALHPVTAETTAWNPDVTGGAVQVIVVNGGTVYAGG